MTAGFPAIQASSQASNTVANILFTLPAGTQPGDLLVAVVTFRQALSSASPPSAPDGSWTLWSTSWAGPNTATRQASAIYYKTAGVGETDPVFTSGSGRTAGVLYRISGFKTGALSAEPLSTFTQGASGNWDAPSITFSHSGKKYLVFAVCTEESTANAIGYPAGYALGQNTVEAVGGNSSGTRVTVAAKEVSGQASEDPGAGTSTSVGWNAVTFAIEGVLAAKAKTPFIWV